MTRVFFAGADVRDDPSTPDRDWSAERRASFLMRPDVERPLSLDPNVWGTSPSLREQPLRPVPWVSIEDVHSRALPVLTAPNDLSSVLIAIGLVAANADEEAEARTHQGVDTELHPEPDWRFVGFDVADGAISGLSNCGYDPSCVDELRTKWAGRLNVHGLFSAVTDAIAFRALTDARVSEHAPFFVYGIWIVGSAAKRRSPP